MREDADLSSATETLPRERRAPASIAAVERRARRPAVRYLGTTLLFLVIALVVYAWPSSFGGRSTIVFVRGNSMLPTLSTDDVVFARAHVRYAVGDLVVFRVPAGAVDADPAEFGTAYVIHRIVGGSETTGWVTQGDNRNHVDPWFLSDDDIVGRAERKAAVGPVALAGVRLMLTPLLWAAVAAIVAFVLALRWLSGGEAGEAGDGAGLESRQRDG